MAGPGAEEINIVIPGLYTPINSAGVINFEFKYDLIDYLAGVPNAPVKSLGEILDKGLYQIALEMGLRNRERQGTRDSDAYRAALAQRIVSRDLVVAFMEANKL